MEEKIDGWIDTHERFVAFLDIMGFKDFVYRNSHEDVKKMLESLYPSIYIIEKEAQEKLSGSTTSDQKKYPAFGDSVVKPIIFSDSIVLITGDDSEQSANKIIFCIEWLCGNAIGNKVPIKGALAHGEFTADLKKSLYFGKPLIDAYELESELCLYSVVLHNTMEKYLYENKLIEVLEKFALFRYPTPIGSSFINHYHVDWTHAFEKEVNIEGLVSEFYFKVSGRPRSYVDNTLKFVRQIKTTRKRE